MLSLEITEMKNELIQLPSPRKVTFDSYGDEQYHSEQGWMATKTEKLGCMQGTQELSNLESVPRVRKFRGTHNMRVLWE